MFPQVAFEHREPSPEFNMEHSDSLQCLLSDCMLVGLLPWHMKILQCFFFSYVFIGRQDGMSPPVAKVVLKLFISELVKTVDFSREIISFQDHQFPIDW